jgi:hypothetical protein
MKSLMREAMISSAIKPPTQLIRILPDKVSALSRTRSTA